MFEKEVEEYVDKHYMTLVSTIGSIRRFEKGIVDAILYFTEPRERQIAELEAQIEKMKCCGNCEHFDFNEPNYCHKGIYREGQYVCAEWNWELRS